MDRQILPTVGCRCGTEKRGLDPSQRPGSTKAHHALGCLHGIFNRRVALAGNLRPLLIAASIFACCCSRRAASGKRRPQRQLGPSQVLLRHHTRGSANSQPRPPGIVPKSCTNTFRSQDFVCDRRAQSVSQRGAAACPELRVDRKWRARCQSDAIDPQQTWRMDAPHSIIDRLPLAKC